MYATDELLDNPDLLIAAATKLKEEREARLKSEKRVQILETKGQFYDETIRDLTGLKIEEIDLIRQVLNQK